MKKILIGLMVGAALMSQAGEMNKKVIIGYSAFTDNLKGYDILIHPFLYVKDNKVNPDRFMKDKSSDFVKNAHGNGALAFVSLNGDIKESTAPEKLEEYVAQVIEYVRKYDYDGVDVDWEYPRDKEQGKQWNNFIKLLREKIDAVGKEKGRRMYLSSAVFPRSWVWENCDPKVIRECLDYLNVMCYDYAMRTSSYHAPVHANPADPAKFSYAQLVDKMADKLQYPKDKIIIGVPFYGCYMFADNPIKPYTKVEPSSNWKQISYYDLKKKIETEGFSQEYEPNSFGVWSWSPDRKSLILYDSSESIYNKSIYYLTQGYGGIFCWCVNQENKLQEGQTPLTDALMKARKDFSIPKL